MNSLTSLLQDARNAKGLTQQRVADQLGVTVRTYQRYEYRERKISLELATKLSEILNISIEDLAKFHSQKGA